MVPLTDRLYWGILIQRPGGTGAAEATEPRQVREEAAVRRPLWAPPANLPGCILMAAKTMQTPPICNYEGSNYQTSFWEQGGRDYEDAVEEVALRRLLPPGGKRLLELGAGAGRNTLRYTGFEQITLVDYSTTQLEQARQRLGESDRFRYIAADVYHLPFGAGSYDAATMIRTLHHMADARSALDQVRKTLQAGSVFILEYANKQNLKSILRYSLHRQGWNPFSPEPIEFAPLNYDFHPATVRNWLQLSGFAIERQLTVSHFRIGWLKRSLPLRLLVQMDALAQLTGDMWQYSPSVFVRAHALGQAGSSEGTLSFHCPACEAPLADTPPQLDCARCGRNWQVKDGIYDFRLGEAAVETQDDRSV
jgi:ubiquinone/menaquinone biosynthesis C-methylase UbiE